MGFSQSTGASTPGASEDYGDREPFATRIRRRASFAAFEKAVLKLRDVLDCVLVAGDCDYLLKIRVRDMADFNKLQGTS